MLYSDFRLHATLSGTANPIILTMAPKRTAEQAQAPKGKGKKEPEPQPPSESDEEEFSSDEERSDEEEYASDQVR
jgi:hypothetical protein